MCATNNPVSPASAVVVPSHFNRAARLGVVAVLKGEDPSVFCLYNEQFSAKEKFVADGIATMLYSIEDCDKRDEMANAMLSLLPCP